MPSPSDATPAAERRRYIFVERPKCPACRSVRLRCYASRRQGDSSLTRYSRCLDCGTKIIMVLT